MRKLLLVSYHVPPRTGIGTERTRQLLTYLPAYGWDVTVLTAQVEHAPRNVIQTSYLDVRAMLKRSLGLGDRSAHAVLGAVPARTGVKRTLRQRAVEIGFAVTHYPDGMIGWLPGGIHGLRRILAAQHFDAILSSAPPFTTNLILGSTRSRIPWVADFRDLWTDSDAHSSLVRRWCDNVLEAWSLQRATLFTTISEPMAQALRSRHQGMRVEVIPNAFDAAEWSGVPFAMEPRCTIVYAGALYRGRRDPQLLFRALRSLIDAETIAHEEVRVDMYTTADRWLADMICEYGLQDVVNVREPVPREEIHLIERRANRLLVFLWDGPGAEGTLTGKLFEYLGARRRIVVAGGPKSSAVDQVLETTGAGVRCTNEGDLQRELLAAVQEHRRSTLGIVPEHAVAPYEASRLAQMFAQTLDSVAQTTAQEGPHALLEPMLH
jgi:glycosyltransferase involved in cell wall biosynthesis